MNGVLATGRNFRGKVDWRTPCQLKKPLNERERRESFCDEDMINKCMSGWFELQVQLPSAHLWAALAGVFASDDARPLTTRFGRRGRRLSRLRAGSRRAGGQPHRKSQTQSSLQLVISLTFFAPSQIGKILVGAKTKPYRAVMKKSLSTAE